MAEKNPLYLHMKAICKELGQDQIVKIHKKNIFLDWFAIVLVPSLFFLCGNYLITSTLSLTWFFCLFLQGFILQAFGLMAHELFTHRKVAGRMTYFFDLLFCVPFLRKPAFYQEFHLCHHNYLNSENDPERDEIKRLGGDIKQRRYLFLTAFGQFLSQTGDEGSLQKSLPFVSRLEGKKSLEKFLIKIFFCLLVIFLYFYPKIIFFGYFLPALTVLPLVSMTRIILEHADVDPENPLQAATFYKTNWLTRLLFCWDSGDCHLVHHLFPMVPYYRMGLAIKLIRPYLMRNGVREHKSLFCLFRHYLCYNTPFRSPWKI